MASESIKLPIIDFSSLKQGTSQWETVKKQVWEACEEYGCFEASFDRIPPHLRKSTFDGLQQIFDLPLQAKKRHSSNLLVHSYSQYPPLPHTLLHESMGIDDVLATGKLESFVNLMWPEGGNPLLRKSIASFTEQLSELDHIVRRMVLESLGLEKYLDEHIESTNYLFRLMKYHQSQDPTNIGLPGHIDKSVITILSQNDVSGLQVLTKDGKQWITLHPSPNSFIVLVGQFLYAWTNGRVYPPHHRVVMTGEKDRYSTAIFTMPKKGYIVKAPDEMVDEEHPLLFKPFDCSEFLEYFNSETKAGLMSQDALKDYCGA